MAEEKKQSFNLGLTIVALVALVSIVSLVALVLFSAKSPSFATGGQLVAANSEGNVAGQGTYIPTTVCNKGVEKVYCSRTNTYRICTGDTYSTCYIQPLGAITTAPAGSGSTGSGSTSATGGTALSGDCAKYIGTCSSTPISGKIGYPGLCGSVSILCYR